MKKGGLIILVLLVLGVLWGVRIYNQLVAKHCQPLCMSQTIGCPAAQREQDQHQHLGSHRMDKGDLFATKQVESPIAGKVIAHDGRHPAVHEQNIYRAADWYQPAKYGQHRVQTAQLIKRGCLHGVYSRIRNHFCAETSWTGTEND